MAVLLPLHLVAAHSVDGLRREADVPHDRDVHRRDRRDRLGDVDAALELDRLGAPLLHHAPRVAQRILGRNLVGEKRQIGDDQRPRARPRHHLQVINDLVDRHGQRRVEALHHHAERVADEDDVDACLVDDLGEREIVSRQGRDLRSRLLHSLEVGHRHFPFHEKSLPANGRERLDELRIGPT